MNTKLFSALAMAALAVGATSCSNDDAVESKGYVTTSGVAGTGTRFIAGTPSTRTSVNDATNPRGFLWTDNDQIIVVGPNASGVETKYLSSKVTGGPVSSYVFNIGESLPGNSTGPGYDVYYAGSSAPSVDHYNEVTIKSAITRTTSNDLTSIASEGDNGYAKATYDATDNAYHFKLNHQAAYLYFHPTLAAGLTQMNTHITKIEVISDNTINGTYTITPTGLTELTAGTNTITMTINPATANDFKLATDDANNATKAYMVIAPGQHKLTVKYTLRDADNGNTLEFVQPYASYNFQPGEIKDLSTAIGTNYATAVPDNHYYMWDAKDHLWAGNESHQPHVSGGDGVLNFTNPAINDTRFYNNKDFVAASGVKLSAENNYFATNVPNANEMAWYIMEGDPRWDADKTWLGLGHIQKGGIWFKKSSNIPNFSKEIGPVTTDYPSGVDLRDQYNGMKTYSRNISLPSATALTRPANESDYFFIPAAGYYEVTASSPGSATFSGLGTVYYSTSTPMHGSTFAYVLRASKNSMVMNLKVDNMQDRSKKAYLAVPFK